MSKIDILKFKHCLQSLSRTLGNSRFFFYLYYGLIIYLRSLVCDCKVKWKYAIARIKERKKKKQEEGWVEGVFMLMNLSIKYMKYVHFINMHMCVPFSLTCFLAYNWRNLTMLKQLKFLLVNMLNTYEYININPWNLALLI